MALYRAALLIVKASRPAFPRRASMAYLNDCNTIAGGASPAAKPDIEVAGP